MISHEDGHKSDVAACADGNLSGPQVQAQQFVVGLDDRVRDLFRRHASFVWRSLQRLGLDPARAEDGLQDVFLVVHRRIADLRDPDGARAWLFAIARRVASDHRRAERREQRRRERVLSVASTQPTRLPHERYEAMLLLERFLAGLDEDRRVVFYLMELEGMRANEVASALDLNVNTVYTRLRAARHAFNAFVAVHAQEYS